MNVWKQAVTALGLSALIYLIILRWTGELHRSSRALVDFSIFWLVQAVGTLWQAWRHSRGVASIGPTKSFWTRKR